MRDSTSTGPVIPRQPETDAQPNPWVAAVFYCVMALLAGLALAGCGGGGDDPDVGTPRVDCRVEVCK